MADHKRATRSSHKISQRRYNTRQSSRIHRRSGASRRQSSSALLPATEGLRPPTPAPETEAQVPDISEPDEKRLSRLFESLVKFWTLILNEKAWPLRLDPGGITPALPSPPADNEITESDKNVVVETPTGNSSADLGDEKRNSPKPENPDEITTEVSWDDLVLARLVLQEELNRLRLWKVTFSNEDLDLLSKTQDEIVHATSKCLVQVSNTLLEEYAGQQCNTPTELDAEKLILADLVKKVSELIHEVSFEDDVMTEGDCSDTQGSDHATGGQTFLKNLTENIDRLHRLSHSLCLVLDDSKGNVAS